MSKAVAPDDFDGPWKEALDVYFPAFLAWFFPVAFAEINWRRGHEFLDKELRKVMPRNEQGTRVVDQLVKVWLKNGKEEWLLIHVEIQSQEDGDFGRRMFVYNYRVFDRYNRTVVSLAVLGDERANWRPATFFYGKWGCQVGIQFPVVKLLDYAEKEAELEASSNPFAVLVLAHLKTQQTRHDPAARKYWKSRLVRNLFARGMKADDVRKLYRFIDWILQLPKELELEFQETMLDLEREHAMPFITPTERRGMEKGLIQGLEQGLEKGRREAMFEVIHLVLNEKYGAKGLELMAELKPIQEMDLLRAITQKLIQGGTLPSFRRWLSARLK